VYLLPTTFCTK